MMKVNKALSIFFFILLLSPCIGFAQSPADTMTDDQKEALTQNMEAFVEVLELTDAQKPEFEAITKKYMPQMQALKDSDDGRLKKYRKFKAIQKARNAEMEELLSAKQYEIYLEKQKELQKEMEKRKG